MGLFGTAEPKRVVVKSYGRGSFLGLLSPLFAAIMAARGMNGWETSTERAIEKDAVEMARRGYRIASQRESRIPVLGILYDIVTYELIDRPAAASNQDGPPP